MNKEQISLNKEVTEIPQPHRKLRQTTYPPQSMAKWLYKDYPWGSQLTEAAVVLLAQSMYASSDRRRSPLKPLTAE